jgi:hypothetical protein
VYLPRGEGEGPQSEAGGGRRRRRKQED